MTKKHFIAMAAEFKRNKPTDREGIAAMDVWMSAVESFMTVARSTNPRFDRARFLTACGAV